ncbi:MAG: hypothetical protein HY072_02165 [Deltaproteobacteria bacterium]|nr:hypothetical protein [Deltaproteobacteria bacterium]
MKQNILNNLQKKQNNKPGIILFLEDKRTYTFKLKKDIKWSDGVLLKAEHFVYSWKRFLLR